MPQQLKQDSVVADESREVLCHANLL